MNLDSKEIAKMNLAIAVYMGWEKHPFSPDHYVHKEKFGNRLLFKTADYRPDNMKFGESLDWLMPVLEKIRHSHYVVIEMGMGSISCSINDPKYAPDSDDAIYHFYAYEGVQLIDVVFPAVFDFAMLAKEKSKKMSS